MGSQGGGTGGIERMLEESPSVAIKCEKLKEKYQVARDSKEVVARIITVNED